MTEKMVKVNYSFSEQATMLGSMEIPERLLIQDGPEFMWSREAEKYIADRHDFALQPPELEGFDQEFHYIERNP